MRARLQAEPDFARGAADPSLVIERFVSRSARLNDWLRDQASECRLPYVVLSGLESPYDVSSTCLEAMGLKAAATGYRALGDAPRAAHPYGGRIIWKQTRPSSDYFAISRSVCSALMSEDRRPLWAISWLTTSWSSAVQVAFRQAADHRCATSRVGEESTLSPGFPHKRPRTQGCAGHVPAFVSDGEVSQHSLRSSIWKLVGEPWQMIFHQGTPSRAR
jgi:hypothetical protein